MKLEKAISVLKRHSEDEGINSNVEDAINIVLQELERLQMEVT